MEMNSQAQPIPGAPTEQKSIWSIMVGVFTSPAESFQAYKDKPKIIVPLIIVIIMLALAGGMTAKQNAQLSYDMFKNSEVMPAESLQQMRDSIDNPSYLRSALGAPIWPLVIIVLEALVAMFLGNVVFAGKAKFKPIWGVAILSSLIVGLGGLIRVPMVLAKDTLMVSIGPAALLPGGDFTSVTYFFLYTTDLFAIWSIIVGGIGYGIIFGISRGKGMAISIISFLLFTTIVVGMLTTLFSLGGADVTFF